MGFSCFSLHLAQPVHRQQESPAELLSRPQTQRETSGYVSAFGAESLLAMPDEIIRHVAAAAALLAYTDAKHQHADDVKTSLLGQHERKQGSDCGQCEVSNTCARDCV